MAAAEEEEGGTKERFKALRISQKLGGGFAQSHRSGASLAA